MLEPVFSVKFIILCLVFGSTLCHNEDDDYRIHFRDESYRGNPTEPRMTLQMEIRLAQELNQIETIEDFVTRIHGVPEGESFTPSVQTRFGGDERANVEIPKPATCSPQLQPVSLKNSSFSSSSLYFPSCTRVPRCGGCCTHALLSCQPTATAIRNFQVIVTEYDFEMQQTYKRKEIVPIEEHTKCACSCTIKAEHCNKNQNYVPGDCRCACNNVDEETKCRASNTTKQWDEESCVCRCKGITECTTGSYYDHSTCSCRKIGLGSRRRHVGLEQSENSRSQGSGISGRVPPTFAVSANDPRRRHREDPE